MNDYTLGLLTIPIGLVFGAVCMVGMKVLYILMGKVGRRGVIKFGKSDDNTRLVMGAVVAPHLVGC